MALQRGTQQLAVAHAAAGHAALSAWLERHRVKRVGIEATGSYEGAVVAHLRCAFFTVLLLQPMQLSAYALFLLQLANTDKIYAAFISSCTASLQTIHSPPYPLSPLSPSILL